MALETVIILVIYSQTILVPILGGLYLGIKSERKRKEQLFYRALTVVRQSRRPYA